MTPDSAQQQQTTAASLPSLFLSYARSDDPAFVEALYEKLRGAGFRVWWDRNSMPSRSLTFHQELRDAIAQHDRVLLVLGEVAFQSAYVQAEWQFALAADKVVTPVLRAGSLESIPPELKPLHIVNAATSRPESETFAEILRVASDPPPHLGRTFRVPKPPLHFQPRVEALSNLARYFSLDAPQRLTLDLAKRVVTVHGMGGLGKSVLAAALAASTATRRLFSDGVVWLTFQREERDAIPQLQYAGEALSDNPRHYTTDQAAARLDRWVKENNPSVLFVLDNVWWDWQVHPFRSAMGSRSQMLVTTRDAGIAARLGQAVALDLPSDDESLAILADWTGTPVGALPAAAREIVEECGRLPFALALAGANVGQTSWSMLVDALRRADLTYMRTTLPDYEYTDLLRAQQVSIDALRASGVPDLAEAATRYFDLAAFRWDTPVPEPAITTRWMAAPDVDEPRAAKLLGHLSAKALVRTEGEAPHRSVSLHDLQQDYLTASARMLGRTLAQEHGAILDSYAARYPGAPFSVPGDGYYHNSVFHHLVESGRQSEAHGILRQETGDHKNAWWETRTALGQPFGYESDVRLAWGDVGSELKRNHHRPEPALVAAAVRYAIIIGSIRESLAEVPVRLIRLLLAHHIWTPAQALAAARWREGISSRVEALSAVLPLLSDPDRQEALEDALALAHRQPETDDRARSLLDVANSMTGPGRKDVIRSAVELAAASLPGNKVALLQRAWMLEPSESSWLDGALGTIEEQVSPEFWIQSLAAVVPNDQLSVLIRAAKSIEDPDTKARVLSVLLARGPDQECIRELETVLPAASPSVRLACAAALARIVPEKAKGVAEAAEGILPKLDKNSRLSVVPAIIPFLAGSVRVRAEKQLFADIMESGSDSPVVSLLNGKPLVKWLKEREPVFFRSLLKAFAGAIAHETNIYTRTEAIEALDDHLPSREIEVLLEEALRRAQVSDDINERLSCLGRLAPHMSTASKPAALDVLISRIGRARDWKLLDALALATEQQFDQLLDAGEREPKNSELATMLGVLCAKRQLWDQMHRALERVRGTYDFERFFRSLPAGLPQNIRLELLYSAMGTKDPEIGGPAIAALAPGVDSTDEQRKWFRAGIQAVQVLAGDHKSYTLARDMLPYLPCDLTDEMDSAIQRKTQFELELSQATAVLAVRLADCGRLKQALETWVRIPYSDIGLEAVIKIASKADPKIRDRLLEEAEAKAVEELPSTACRLLASLAQVVAPSDRARIVEKAVEIAEAIEDTERFSLLSTEELRAEALLSTAPLLDEPRRTSFLLQGWRNAPKGSSSSGMTLLQELAPHLASLPPDTVIGPWLHDLEAASRSRSAVLREVTALAILLDQWGGEQAMDGIAAAVNDAARWWPDTV